MRSDLALAGLTLVLMTGARASQAQVPAPAPPTVTNSIGMQFIRIEPGTMQVGVFHPDCANGARAGGAGPGRAAAPPPRATRCGARAPAPPLQDNQPLRPEERREVRRPASVVGAALRAIRA